MQFLVGADPEVFVKQNNRFVTGHGLIEGDKQNPFPVENGAVQVDGMALEFNIDPASNEQEFLYNVQHVLSQLSAMVPEHEIAAEPVAEFGAEYLSSMPPKAVELGCDPDYNAWSYGGENEKPDENVDFRTGAGHIHIGWCEGANIHDPYHIDVCCSLVKQLDFYLGLPSLLFDKSTKRRSLYGAAGAYRAKPYGVEYRVLSNKWLASPELIAWAYRATVAACKACHAGDFLADRYGDIQGIINSSDMEAAMEIVNREGLEVPDVPQ